MTVERVVSVHLLPSLVDPGALKDGTAVVIDVLRATTTIVHALAAGCSCVHPVAEIEEAKQLANQLEPAKVLLGGERHGVPIEGFHLGNSPSEYQPHCCHETILVLTTTNGTGALLHARHAERILVAGFVNFSATCAALLQETRPLHLLCAGTDGEISLEDTLLAGAFVDAICADAGPPPRRGEKRLPNQKAVRLNDSARLAWDCFTNHGMVLEEALKMGAGGRRLLAIGADTDVRTAAQVDRFFLTVECRRDPLRLEIGQAGVTRRRWHS